MPPKPAAQPPRFHKNLTADLKELRRMFAQFDVGLACLCAADLEVKLDREPSPAGPGRVNFSLDVTLDRAGYEAFKVAYAALKASR